MREPKGGTGQSATRRGLLLLSGCLFVSRGARGQVLLGNGSDPAAPPIGAPGQPTLLVGGAPGGTARAFADLLAPLLGASLAGLQAQGADGAVSVATAGGLDGVTAANEFEARAAPDGSAALMVPGTAAMAWLAGDPRVHFDAGLWVPAFAAVAPGVVVGRMALSSLGVGAPVRLAASTPAGCELPAILGLELLRLRADPVFGLRQQAEQEAALRDGRADAMLLSGPKVPERLAGLRQAGFEPLFALDGVDGTAEPARNPALPDVETLHEIALRAFSRPVAGPLAPAYRAASAASMLDALLVLPQLAPAGAVARWRAACTRASMAPSVVSATGAASLQALAATASVDAVSAILVGETTLLDLHRFLADRFGWRPA